MSQIGIVTDTISCLPPELVQKYGIRVVPIGLLIDGRLYMDDQLSNEEFWRLFYQAKTNTTTSAANAGDFAAVFADLARFEAGIACILVSKALSTTHESAVQAMQLVKQKAPDVQIEVIDSWSAAGAEGFIVLEAARAAQAGKSFAEVIQVASDIVARVRFVTAMDTLNISSGPAGRPKQPYWAIYFA